jgi:hypothetical protein
LQKQIKIKIKRKKRKQVQRLKLGEPWKEYTEDKTLKDIKGTLGMWNRPLK